MKPEKEKNCKKLLNICVLELFWIMKSEIQLPKETE